MSEQFLHLTKEDRITLVRTLYTNCKQFQKELEKIILEFLNTNKINKFIAPEIEVLNQARQDEIDKTIENINSASSVVNDATATSSSSVATVAGVISNAASLASTSYFKRKSERLKVDEAKTRLNSSIINIYITKNQNHIAKSVAANITYQLQFLIACLDGGTEGYMKLANFLGEAIKSNAVRKVPGNTNIIEALIDSAVPKPNSFGYKTSSRILSLSIQDSLKINDGVNEIKKRGGLELQSLLGKPKYKNKNYLISAALNSSYTLDTAGNFYAGKAPKPNDYMDNSLPVKILAANGEISDLGQESGMYATGQTLAPSQVSLINRIACDFFKKELNRHLSIEDTPSPISSIIDHQYSSFSAESLECSWTEQRRIRWKKRREYISQRILDAEKISKKKLDINEAGRLKKEASCEFDAQEALNELNHTLYETKQALYELNTPENDIQTREEKKELTAKSAQYITLAIHHMINCIEKLDRNHPKRNEYLSESISALRAAKETVETTRESPLAENKHKEQINKQLIATTQKYELWAAHLAYCQEITSTITSTAKSSQAPSSVQQYTYQQTFGQYDLAKSLIKQAEDDETVAYNYLQQASIIENYSKTNTNNQEIISRYQDLDAQFYDEITQESVPNEEEDDLSLMQAEPWRRHPLLTSQTNQQKSHLTQSIKEASREQQEAAIAIANDDGQKERNSLSIDFLNESESNDIEALFLRMEGFLNDIYKTRNAIFSSLEINGQQPLKNQYEKLSICHKKIVGKTCAALKAAKEKFELAKSQQTIALKKYWFKDKGATAKAFIIDSEKYVKAQRQQLIDCIDELEKNYIMENKDHINDEVFNATSQAMVNKRFKFMIRQIYLPDELTQTKENSTSQVFCDNTELKNLLDHLDNESQEIEHGFDKENAKQAQKIYENAQGKINALGTEPLSLSQATQYADIAKNAKENIKQAATGSMVTNISLYEKNQRTITDANIAISNSNLLKQKMTALIQNCQTDAPENVKKNVQFTNIQELAHRVSEITAALNNEDFTDEDVPKNILYIIHSLYKKTSDQTSEVTNAAIRRHVASELNKQHSNFPLSTSARYINWEVWILAMIARIAVKYDELNTQQHIKKIDKSIEQIEQGAQILFDDRMKNSASGYNFNSPLAIIQLQTKLLILCIYQQLDKEIQLSKKHASRDLNLTTTAQLMSDQFSWSCTMNHFERKEIEQERDTNGIFAEIVLNQLQPVPINAIPKTNRKSIKLIYQQLLEYCQLSIREKNSQLSVLEKHISTLDKYNNNLACNFAVLKENIDHKEISTLR